MRNYNVRYYKRLCDCYSNPSKAKREIYNACIAKAIDDGALLYGIETYNVHMFTFGYETLDGRYCRITPKNFFEVCRGYY